MEIFTDELEKENPKIPRNFFCNLHQNDNEEERTIKVAFSKEKLRTEIIFQVVCYKRQLNSLTPLDMEINNLMQLKQPGLLLAKKMITL